MSSYQIYAEKVYTGTSVLNNQLISVENGFISSIESSGFVEGALAAIKHPIFPFYIKVFY